jgi:hypothetical protein
MNAPADGFTSREAIPWSHYPPLAMTIVSGYDRAIKDNRSTHLSVPGQEATTEKKAPDPFDGQRPKKGS